jgi:hypothetical protein
MRELIKWHSFEWIAVPQLQYRYEQQQQPL